MHSGISYNQIPVSYCTRVMISAELQKLCYRSENSSSGLEQKGDRQNRAENYDFKQKSLHSGVSSCLALPVVLCNRMRACTDDTLIVHQYPLNSPPFPFFLLVVFASLLFLTCPSFILPRWRCQVGSGSYVRLRVAKEPEFNLRFLSLYFK